MINPITNENYSKKEVQELAYNVKSRVVAGKDFAYTINVIIHSYQLALRAILELAEEEGWSAELKKNKELAEEMISVWSKAYETIHIMSDTLL